ncbi:hypothetical protein GCM10009682_11030 [Luedemannella flava]|uniref:Uncharacterized protein n=1 Tax=Luedemannella flava TaxID=349316 RepID=A0ABN2LLI9_9ACTN
MPVTTMPMPDDNNDAWDVLAAFDTVLSADFDDYATGLIPAWQVRCALCQQAPCQCPPFGTPAYIALVDARHGRPRQS